MAAAESPDHSDAVQLSSLQLEYAQVNDNFRMLADIRFKLLALVPALGGLANFVLSGFALSKDATAPPPSLVLMIGVIGFLATLGITIYDQRNTELYDALIGRAKYLEDALKLPPDPKRRPPGEYRGQFKERPPRSRYLFGSFSMGHDRGLALIYGPVLGAWFFPSVYAALKGGWLDLGDWPQQHPLRAALASAGLMTLLFLLEFLRLDSKWKALSWKRLWPQSDHDDSS